MSQYSCIDIGGTAIKYGVADERGCFLETGICPTDVRKGGAAQLLQHVCAIITQQQRTHCIAGVAVATAGMVDPATGRILYASDHFPGYTGTAVQTFIEAQCHVPCAVENDVNAAALGEYWQGAGQGAATLFCLTVGTGIGGCSMIDGHVIHGAACSAGEIGYMPLDEAGHTLEELASVTALVRAVGAAKHIPPKELDGKTVFLLARQGDAIAIKAIDDMLRWLARGIATVCYVLNPEKVIIGGGIMAEEAYIKPRLMRALKQSMLPVVYTSLQVDCASLGNHAGMIGALYHFLQRKGRV